MRAFNRMASAYWRGAHGMDKKSGLEQCLDIARHVKGVLHVGANRGLEAGVYANRGIHPVTWIEANPQLEAPLKYRVNALGHRVIIAAVSDCNAEHMLHVTNNDSESSSLLPLAEHKAIWPSVHVVEEIAVQCKTLNELHAEHGFSNHNFWVLDIQGMEARALRGADRAMAVADYILCEFSSSLYRGGSTVEEIDAMLGDFSAIAGWRSDCGRTGEILYQRFRRSGCDLLRCL